MALIEQQTRLVHTRDTHVRQVLAHGGGNENLLISLADSMETGTQLLETCAGAAMDTFCDQYDGSPALGHSESASLRALPRAAVLCLHERVEHEKGLWCAPSEHSAWPYPGRSTRTMLLSPRRPRCGSVVSRL